MASATPDLYSYLPSHRASPPSGTKLYCLVTEAHVCEQRTQGRYMKLKRPGVEPRELLIYCESNALTISPPRNRFSCVGIKLVFGIVGIFVQFGSTIPNILAFTW